MKVLHLIMSFNTGGAEKLLIDLMNKNSKVNQELVIVNDVYEKSLIEEMENKSNIKFIGRPEGSKNLIYLIRIVNLVRKISPNIIHCHNIASFKISIILKKLFCHIKIVYTIHDNNIIKDNKKLVNKINRYCDQVISISDSVTKECIESGIKKNKINTIFNGIDVKKFDIPKKKHEKINIGCVARLNPEKKGQDILIQAFREISNDFDAQLLLAGEVTMKRGKKSLEDLEKLKELCQTLNISEKVIFCGNVDNIPEFLSNIDILVLPSRYEGFGLALIEGMAAKIPVIASDIDGPRMIIKDKYGYLFPVNDYKALSRQLVSCLQNYDKTVEDAYLYVNNNYSIESMIDSYTKTYINIMKNKNVKN